MDVSWLRAILAAPTVAAPTVVADRHVVAVGGLLGVGFAADPGSGRDLLRAAGFSPSGASLVVATSSVVTLWTRA